MVYSTKLGQLGQHTHFLHRAGGACYNVNMGNPLNAFHVLQAMRYPKSFVWFKKLDSAHLCVVPKPAAK